MTLPGGYKCKGLDGSGGRLQRVAVNRILVVAVRVDRSGLSLRVGTGHDGVCRRGHQADQDDGGGNRDKACVFHDELLF